MYGKDPVFAGESIPRKIFRGIFIAIFHFAVSNNKMGTEQILIQRSVANLKRLGRCSNDADND